jgi:hypothetical protein
MLLSPIHLFSRPANRFGNFPNFTLPLNGSNRDQIAFYMRKIYSFTSKFPFSFHSDTLQAQKIVIIVSLPSDTYFSQYGGRIKL